MGHHGRHYTGLSNFLAPEITLAYGAPTKKLMTSWIFNRLLVATPGRPKP